MVVVLKCSKQHGEKVVALFVVAAYMVHDTIALGMLSETYGPESHVD